VKSSYIDVNIVARTNHFVGRPSYSPFRPHTRHDDVLAARLFNRLSEAGVVPRIHRGALHDSLPGEHVEQLRHDVAGKTLGLDGGDYGGHVELLRALGEEGDVVEESCTIRVRD